MDINVIIPGGRQIHATQNGGEWKIDTYLYEDNLGEGESDFYFEQYCPTDHQLIYIPRAELKEHITKLLPLLFTPEELKKLCEGSPPKNG